MLKVVVGCSGLRCRHESVKFFDEFLAAGDVEGLCIRSGSSSWSKAFTPKVS